MSFSRVIPSYEELAVSHNPLTEGEKYLIEFLDKNLQGDSAFSGNEENLEKYNGWLIFVQPYLNNSRPDIVLYNPYVGIQIIEVKDWSLNYCSLEYVRLKYRMFVKSNGSVQPVKRPDEQVSYYKSKIINILVPQIGESIDRDVKNFGLIKTSLYFHNATTNQCKEFFKSIIKDTNVFPVFGKDSLVKSKLNEIIPFTKYSKSKFWERDWNKHLLFWLKPPYHSIEQGTPLILSKYQMKYSEPTTGHHRIRGVAGSGKTQVLAYRAAKLASKNKNVLILSFNLTLIHYIKDMLKRVPIAFDFKNICLNHYHGFCSDILNDYGVEFPYFESEDKEEREDYFKVVITDLVLQTIKSKKIFKYDAILIDEGQDYYYEWYNLLTQFLNPEGELVVMCDKKQNIYDRDFRWLDKRRTGLEKFGEWNEMKDIYRLPELIAKTVNSFSQEFKLNQEVKEAQNNNSQISLFEKKDPHFIWKNVDKKGFIKEIWNYFSILSKEGFHPSDTTIILPYHKLGVSCREYFVNKGIEVNDVFGTEDGEKKSHKMSFYQGDSRLKMCTIHSFKGWETANVILYIDEWVPEDWESKVMDEESCILDSLIYTSLTRSKLNVIVVNSNQRYWAFGDKFSSIWKNGNSVISLLYNQHIIIDSIFLNKAIRNTISLYKEMYPDREFSSIMFDDIINNLRRYFIFDDRVKVIILESEDNTLDLEIVNNSFKLENTTFLIEKKKVDIVIMGIDDCIEEGEIFKDIILLGDDIGYIPVIEDFVKKGTAIKLVRNPNDTSNMISNNIRSVKWQDIEYILGPSLGLSLNEL